LRTAIRDVDDDVENAECRQAREMMFDERHAGDLEQRLRPIRRQ